MATPNLNPPLSPQSQTGGEPSDPFVFILSVVIHISILILFSCVLWHMLMSGIVVLHMFIVVIVYVLFEVTFYD